MVALKDDSQAGGSEMDSDSLPDPLDLSLEPVSINTTLLAVLSTDLSIA